MANCTYDDVKRIIETSLEDADITALIVLADAEITARGLTSLNSDVLKAISRYLPADMIQPETIRSGNIGAISGQNPPPPNWRQRAELLISKARVSTEPPIYVANEPVETGE